MSVIAYADAYFGIPGGVFRMDASRLGAGYLDGEPVQVAPDLLGQGRAVQDVLAQRPLYKISEGQASLEFINSATTYFTGPDSLKIFSDDPFAFFSVIRRTNAGNTVLYTWGGDDGGGVTNYAIYLRFRDLERILAYANGVVLISATNIMPLGLYVISHYFDGAQVVVRINGVEVLRGTPGAKSNVTNSPFYIGRQTLSTIGTLTGDYHDFLAYQQILPLPTIEYIERALAGKWGVTL